MCGAGDQSLQLANMKGALLEGIQPNAAAGDPRRRCAEVQNLTLPSTSDHVDVAGTA